MSSFSTEIQDAFKTPTRASHHLPDAHRDVREASIAVMLDTEAEATERAAKIKVDSGYAFTESHVRDCHSPMPTGSVQKLLRVTGAGSAASLALSNTSLTPSGHNSERKIKQIMGLDIPLDEAAPCCHRPAQEISPLTSDSRSSSIYSQDQGGTVSEADTEPRQELEHLSTPDTSIGLSSNLEPQGLRRSASPAFSAVPASLHIVKTMDRSTFRPNLSPLAEPSSPTKNNYSHANGAFRQDLYHATVSELAGRSTSSSSAYSVKSSNSDRQDGGTFSHPGINIVHLSKRQPGFAHRSYQSKMRFAPQLSKLDTLNASRYNAPVKTPYPLPMSELEFAGHGTTSPLRDYDNDGSLKTTIKRPSLMDRIIRHASSPLSPTGPFTTAAETTAKPAPTTHASALPSPGGLQPPPLLKHRKARSQDIRESHAPTVSRISTNNHPAPIGRTAAVGAVPAPTSRRATAASQNYPAQPRSGIASRAFQQQHHPAPHPPTSRRASRPTTTPDPFPAPFAPPPPTDHRRAKTPSPAAHAAVRTLSAWAGRTARQAASAGLLRRTRSERRRSKLKSNIRVMVVGRGSGSPGESGGEKERGAGAGVGDSRGTRVVAAEQPAGGARGRYHPGRRGRGEEAVRGGRGQGAAAAGGGGAVGGGRPFERYTPEKAAENVRGLERAAAAETKVWI